MIIITIRFYNNKLGKAPRSTKIMVKFSILIKEKKKEKRWNNNCESHNKDDSNEKSCKNNEQQPTQLNIYVFYDSQQI